LAFAVSETKGFSVIFEIEKLDSVLYKNIVNKDVRMHFAYEAVRGLHSCKNENTVFKCSNHIQSRDLAKMV
jgi:hypothetical protein